MGFCPGKISVINCKLLISERVFTNQNSPKSVGSAPDPAGGAHDAPLDPVVGWGWGYPFPFPLDPFGVSFA